MQIIPHPPENIPPQPKMLKYMVNVVFASTTGSLLGSRVGMSMYVVNVRGESDMLAVDALYVGQAYKEMAINVSVLSNH